MILQNHTIPVNENDGLPLSKCYWAILATALGVGISVIDVTIANVALPTIACDLGTSPSATIWIVNAYQIAVSPPRLLLSTKQRKTTVLFFRTTVICPLNTDFWVKTPMLITGNRMI